MQAMIECISLTNLQKVEFPAKSILCLGNFDGVHFAHRKLLRLAVHLRNERFPKAACAVFCFRTLSSDYLSDAPKPLHLSTLAQKLDYFREEGIEYVFLADFPSMREFSKEKFVKEILKQSCHCVGAVCGFNYRFGKNGAGSAKMLSDLLEAPVFIQEELCINGETVSSTRIRRLLLEGNAEEAAKLLTRPYCFESVVVHGKSLGHQWNIPTINQYFPQNMLIPHHGVYVTDCEINGKRYRGVSNVGVHPTVDSHACVNCETYLLDFSGDLYETAVKISFLKFLRSEKKFENAKKLQEQIQKDIQAAKAHP